MGLRNAWKGLFTSNDDLNKRRNKLKRMYSGARFDRTNLSWVTPLSSPDQSYKNSINTLRKRVHDLVRNNNYAAQAIRYSTNQIVGQGVKLQAQIRSQRGGTINTRLNEAIEGEWSKWGRKDSCDIRGVLCFSELERLAVRSMIESGECFIIIHRKAFGRSKIPFSLELLEAEQLDEDYKGVKQNEKNVWRLGIELSPEGRAVNYAFLAKHPGDTNFSQTIGQKNHIIVPAKDVVHLFLPLRPGQHRGVPFLASAINHLHQLDGYIEATVVGQRASSALMGFITSPEGELDAPDLDKANGEFEPFVRSMLRSMASGLGCSFEAISSDYSQSNYSSSRLAMLQDRDHWRTIQKMLKETFYQPIYEYWLEMAVLSNVLTLPTYSTTPEVYEKVRWVCRGYSYVDPQKEIAGMKDAVRCGFKTLTDVVSEAGGDIEELLITRQTELAKLDDMNIILDTDPSATNKAGGSQFKPLNTVDPFGDTDEPSGEDAENIVEDSSGSY